MFPFYCFPLEARAHTLKPVATVPLHNECHTTSETTAAKPADAEACPFRLVFCLSFRANQFGLGGSREHTALEQCVGVHARHGTKRGNTEAMMTSLVVCCYLNMTGALRFTLASRQQAVRPTSPLQRARW